MPKAVPIIAGFLFLATLIASIIGFSLVFPGPAMDWMWELNKPGAAVFQKLGRVSGVFLLALAGGTYSSAVGLLRRKRWAWWFAVTLFAVDVTGNISTLFVTHDFPRSGAGAAISGAFLFFLLRRNVREYFR